MGGFCQGLGWDYCRHRGHGNPLAPVAPQTIGAAAAAAAAGDEAPEDPAAAEGDRPELPAHPNYEGLAYRSADALPRSAPDVPFPPAAAAVC